MTRVLCVIAISLLCLSCGHEHPLTEHTHEHEHNELSRDFIDHVHEPVPQPKDVEALYDELSGNYTLLWVSYVRDGVVLVRFPGIVSGEMSIERHDMSFKVDIRGIFSVSGQHHFRLDTELDKMWFIDKDIVSEGVKYHWGGHRLLLSYDDGLLRDVLWLKLD